MEQNIDFLSGSKLALENAKRLIACADAIAAMAEYGPANSLLILAIEECVKAGFLFSCAVINGFPGKTVDLIKLLRHHKAKHYLGFVTQLMLETAASVAAGEKFQSSIDDQFRDIDSSDAESVLRRLEGFIGESVSHVIENMQFALARNVEIGNRKWWRDASFLRNRGFYIDYESDTWITPTSVTKNDFDQSKEIVTKLLAEIESYKVKGPEGLAILRQLISGANEKVAGREITIPDEL